jgi:hypothetical protein
MFRLRQVVFIGLCAQMLVPGAALAQSTKTEGCLGRLGPDGELVVSDLARLVDPQYPFESAYFPDGVFFVPSTSSGAAVLPSSIAESNCYLDLALGKELVQAMVAGANTAIQKRSAVSSLKELDHVFKSVDLELSRRIQIDDGRGMRLSNLSSFIVDSYDLQMPRRDEPSPMQAAIYKEHIYQQWTSVDYVLVQFLAHRGVNLNVEALRRALQRRDSNVAPPTSFLGMDCDKGIEYQWPTMSGAAPGSDKALPMTTYVHWGRCKSTNRIYAYTVGKGWRPASAEEKEYACSTYGHVPSVGQACKTE